MLHVTNGDVAAHRISRLGLTGETLPWQDVLHDGPVPRDLDADGLRRTRAEFLTSAFGLPAGTGLAQLRERDARLERAIRSEEILLWFEPDLYDQLQLLQVLHACETAGSGAILRLVSLHGHFGILDDATLRDACDSREPIRPEDRKSGCRAWRAFRSDNPSELERISRDPPGGLTYVARAFFRLVEEYPSWDRGLARSEAQALEAIAGGATTAAEAFRASAAREEHVYLGDASFALYLQRLGEGERPLVRFSDGTPIPSVDPAGVDRRFWRAPLALTPEGEAVLAGALDRATVLPLDHWIGGVHLHGSEPAWRRGDEGKLYGIR